MPTRTFVLVVALALVPTACRTVDPVPGDADPPESLAAEIAGIAGDVEFHADGAPDDALGADPATLTLAAAVESAVRNDPRLQQSLARWRAARAGCDEARLLPNPLLSVGVLFADALSDATVSVGITQEIAAWLQRPHRAAAADARLRAAAAESLVVALDVVAEVRGRYAALQSVEAQIPVLRERREILSKLRDFERLKVERGEGVRADVTTLDAERASISADLAEREAEAREGRIVLARLAGRPSSAAAWTLDPAGGAGRAEEDERAWIATALARRPEIRALGWELAALGEERAIAGSWPWDGSSAGGGIEYDDGLSAGPAVEFALPLSDAGAPRDAAASAAESEMRHRITETRRRVIEEVRTAWVALDSARRTLDIVADELLPLLERRRAEVEATFRAGESDVVALLLADQALQEVRARRIELEGRATQARIRLERAAGGPRPGPSPENTNAGGTPR